MTRKDDALQDLINGKPWKQLAKQYSNSTLYDAHVKWESLAIKRYEELEEEKKSLDARVISIDIDVDFYNYTALFATRNYFDNCSYKPRYLSAIADHVI